MSNYAYAKAELLVYIKARTPFVVVESSERERVEAMLMEICDEQRMVMEYYTDAKQLCLFGGRTTACTDINHDPLAYAAQRFCSQTRQIFAIGDITRIENDNLYSREFLNLLYLAKESESTVIVVTADPIWSRLSVLGALVKLDFPSPEEIAQRINDFIRQYGNMYPVEWTEKDIQRVATLLKGVSQVQLDNALSAELIARGGLYPQHIHQLARIKDKLFGSVGAVQLIRLPQNVKVSGMEHLKGWLADKREIFFAPDNLLETYDLQAPKGLLVVGVPGCGKSFCAKMIAKEWGLPLYKFDLGNLFDKWMGESERKMRESLAFIDNVSPCVLWIDEIEKMLSTRDSSNDTGNRILGQFLFWLQESASKVFLVATANDITRLPAELFRKGRFSEIFFADLPCAEERADAIALYTQKSLHMTLDEEQMAQVVAATEGYSYADIETAIKEVSEAKILHPDMEITTEMLIRKIQSILPITKSNPELVEDCRAWGRDKAINVSKKGGE